LIMFFKRDRARHYVEREVDWWTLLFFMLLFAVAGTLEHTHVTSLMAEKFSRICGSNISILIPLTMIISAIGSAFIDNVIFVAAFCPVIEELSKTVNAFPLWWALLFGACFGGNITMIGSTANIVALGMLEKRSKIHVKFFDWLKIGLITAFATLLLSWIIFAGLKNFMPQKTQEISKTKEASIPHH
ncbi:MAG TPA: SLC13 family permease, partial [Victivallales bacterium]|nr:SLC13 family permease [Victivallales bacterium]